MASSATTLTAAPPDEPPGNLSLFQGLRLAPKSEVSVEEPSAKASILVFPRLIAPASVTRRTTVASYECHCYYSRIASTMKYPLCVAGAFSTAASCLVFSGFMPSPERDPSRWDRGPTSARLPLRSGRIWQRAYPSSVEPSPSHPR
jgi:hypothetical protein